MSGQQTTLQLAQQLADMVSSYVNNQPHPRGSIVRGLESAIKKVRANAFEEAAKIADGDEWCPPAIGQRIRRLKKPSLPARGA